MIARGKPWQARTVDDKDGNPLTIRLALAEDAQDILALKLSILREGLYDALLPEEYMFDAQQEAGWIKDSTSSDRNLLLVAESENKIVGVLYFRASSEFRCNHWGEFGMGIYETYRGKRIGTILVESLLEWAYDHPRLEKVCLKVFDINPTAVALYQKLGFVEEGRLKKSLRLGPTMYSDAILMAKFVKVKPSKSEVT